jgi:hypothetical protein
MNYVVSDGIKLLPMLAVLCSIKAATTEAVLFTMPETQKHRRANPCTSLSTSFGQSHNEVALRDPLCARECKLRKTVS